MYSVLVHSFVLMSYQKGLLRTQTAGDELIGRSID